MKRLEHRFIAMGGPCRFRIDHTNEHHAVAAVETAELEVRRLESKYSRYLQGSLTSQINANAGGTKPTPIDEETASLLDYADTLYRESDGLFDLTSGVLRQAWNFKEGGLPEQHQLDSLLPLIGWDKVQWDQSSILLTEPGMEIDFGGCVKEYAADSAVSTLRRQDIDHALVDLSGDIAVTGPQANASHWQVGIRHPRKQTHAIAQVSLSKGGLASSGDYERCLEIDGRRYAHILNPQTGWPVEGLIAVSVLSQQCLVAGSSATIAMLKPEQEALQWLDELGLPWLAVDSQLCCHGTLKLAD
jgi:thiamine biosynthesis lipoprotein